MNAVRNLASPLRLHFEFGAYGTGGTTHWVGPPGIAQVCITKTTDFSGIAVDGAALLAGFYHRSVLRCGRLAERNPGVE
jgi:hypothetical protein